MRELEVVVERPTRGTWLAARALPAATAATLLLGAGLRSVQYLARGSMWFDELALADSILARPLGALLTQPLAYGQMAPVGFLAATKAATALLGAGEHGLRLVPWLGSLAALGLLWRVAVRVLSGWAVPAVLLAFAASPALTWYGGNVKPYASDVAVGLLMVLLALRHLEAPQDLRRATGAGLLGAAALTLSLPGVLTAALVGGLLATRTLVARPRLALGPLAVLGGLWSLGAAVTGGASLALRTAEGAAFMERFWVHGFLPAPWGGLDALLWLPRATTRALAHMLVFVTPPPVVLLGGLGVVLAVLGAVVLVRTRGGLVTALLAAPWLGTVVASAARVLPYEGRVSLHSSWPLLVLAAAGLTALVARAGRRLRPGVVGLAGLLAAVPLGAVAFVQAPPYFAQDARPVLEAVGAQWRPGDALFVYYGGRHAIAYYGPQAGLSGWHVGRCHREAPRAYLTELDAYRGRARVWFFYTHAADGFGEPAAQLAYLRAIGHLRAHVPDPHGGAGQLAAEAFLFDLGDPGRLAAAAADTFVLPRQPEGGLRVTCDGRMLDAPP